VNAGPGTLAARGPAFTGFVRGLRSGHLDNRSHLDATTLSQARTSLAQRDGSLKVVGADHGVSAERGVEPAVPDRACFADSMPGSVMFAPMV
jgi:hypothetical protein